MCTRVIVDLGGRVVECDNKGELRDALGVEPIPHGEVRLSEWADESCLCPCDIDATAVAARFSVSFDDTGGYTLRPIHG